MRTIFLGSVLVLLGCRHGFSELSFPLNYSHEDGSVSAAPACAGIAQVKVIDPRPNPAVVGDRTRDDLQTAYPVTANGDVASWVRNGFESQARSAAFALANSNHPTLQVTLRNVEIHEKVFSNGDYNARLVVDVSVLAPTGAICFTNQFEGKGHNYGSEGSPENYVETMNRALDQTVITILDNPQVRDALCGQCSGIPVMSP
jgi:hypothetical protein